jgi:LacI family repressor for deo operon, udp, cdd, tsx, nupC, and nupG
VDLYNYLFLDHNHETTLAHQLRQQLTWLIVNGLLKPGEQLPSIHAMAERLGVNLHTIRGAYLKLEADGLVSTGQGRGTHVLPFDLRRFAQMSGTLRTHTVGVILPSWVNPFYHAFLQGVEELAAQDQTLIFLCNTHDDPQAAWRDFARLSAKQVDGILVVSHDICQILPWEGDGRQQPASIPYVSVDWPGCPGYSVQIDLESAGYQAARHLIEHGHRRIGLITFTMEHANIRPVNQGFERALQDADLQADPACIVRVPGFTLAHGAAGARRLLELPEPPTAIFTIADMLALGAMQAVRAAGLRIPDDIALASFNDIPTAVLVEPALTTVAAPAVQLGREAMKMLQALVAGETPPHEQVILPTKLVIRQSCGAHPIP